MSQSISKENMMLRSTVLWRAAMLGTIFGAMALAGCSDYRRSEESSGSAYRGEREASNDTAQRFRAKDPTIDRFFDSAYGYVVFPEITKGAAGIGAAHGDGGVVYERGVVIGGAEVTQVTVGAQLGGQSFAEIIFFENEAAMHKFKRNALEFSANASAVAAASGAAASADYSDGVAVFTMPNGGLMFEASIGGQKFRYYPD